MQRTIKTATATVIAVNPNGVQETRPITFTGSTAEDFDRELKKWAKVRQARAIRLDDVVLGEETYLMDDDFFFAHARLAKEPGNPSEELDNMEETGDQ